MPSAPPTAILSGAGSRRFRGGRAAPPTFHFEAHLAIIALLEPLPEHLHDALIRHLPGGVEFRSVHSDAAPEAQALAAEADVLLVWNGPLPSATLAAARGAKLAQVCDRRPRGVDFFTARRRGLPVCGPDKAGATAAAEHALLLGLACLRRLPDALTYSAASRDLGVGLAGRSVGLLGMDSVGHALARSLLALGAEVSYWDGATGAMESAPNGTRAVQRYEVLAAADLVSLHLSPTPDHRAAIGRETLRLMRRDAVLVNVSSPELIDEVSLYQSIANGRLAGAALDGVIDPTTLPDHPLRGLPNVLITSGRAAATAEAVDELAAAAMANAARVLNGETPNGRWA